MSRGVAHHGGAAAFAWPRPSSAGELSSVIGLAKPGFDLFSPGSLVRLGVELTSNAANLSRFRSVVTDTKLKLRDVGSPLRVKRHRPAPPLVMPATLTRSKRRWFGQIALELYFTQLFQSDAAILDFWPSRLGVDLDGHAVWAPRPLYLSWDPAFLDGVRNVYAGFFLDDGERFRHGLAAVGLNSSPEILLGHLGDGNQRSVRFRRQMLDSTLRRTAGQLGADGIRLHSNFAAFGFGVAALYASLETLDRSFDVRSAFLRSYPEA